MKNASCCLAAIGSLGEVVSANVNAAAGGRDDAGEAAQSGGLACAVWSNEAHDFAGLNLKVRVRSPRRSRRIIW